MWRWSVLFYLLISNKHSSSQSLTDENRNDRQPRQLDFGDCCPCPGTGQAELGFAAQESMAAARQGTLGRERDLDLCPCNARQSDSEGASSVFFPTAMRADGSVVRPAEKKEDIKPLLYPEVDLASSVLQTLREVTDEEYRDALERDAARSGAEVEESIFGDAIPEASARNVVTVIVSPKHIEHEDDFMPQESHIQEPRCIAPGLQNTKMETGKMRLASKPPNLLREIFELPKLGKSADRLHRNLWDMDSSIGASNIQEKSVNVNNDHSIIQEPTTISSIINRLDSNGRSLKKSPTLKSFVGDDYNDTNASKVRISSVGLKLKDLLTRQSPLESKNNIIPLPSVPKLKLDNMRPMVKDTQDLKWSPSNIQEQEVKKIPYYKTKSHIQEILEKTRPLSLNNLLKLKDVELIPFKDLINTRVTKPAAFKNSKIILPDILTEENHVISTQQQSPLTRNNKNSDAKIEKEDSIEMLTRNNVADTPDPEVNPSQIIEYFHVDNCNESVESRDETGVENNNNKIDSSENALNSDNQKDVNAKSTHEDSNHIEEFTGPSDHNDCEILRVTDTNQPQSTESSLLEKEIEETNDITQDGHSLDQEIQQESNEGKNKDNCQHSNKDADSSTNSSNNIKNFAEPNESFRENSHDTFTNIADEYCNDKRQSNDEEETHNRNDEPKIIRPLSLNDSLLSIKENIIKTLESLPKITPNIPNLFNRTPINHDNVEEKEASSDSHGNQNFDDNCDQSEVFIPTTTAKFEDCENDKQSLNDASDNVSLQDLQNISNSMLQIEEKHLKAKVAACNNQSEESSESDTRLDMNTKDAEVEDMKKSANNHNAIFINAQNDADIGIPTEKVSCLNDELSLKQSLKPKIDSNSEASNVIINRVPQSSNLIGSNSLRERTQQRENNINLSEKPHSISDILHVSSLPTFDDMKLKLNNLFDHPRGVEEQVLSEANFGTDQKDINSMMATGASTNSFRSKPSLRLEDINLHNLHLKSQPRLNLQFPKMKPKLPLLKDINLKPLQSVFKEKSNDFGISALGRHNINSPLKSISNLGDFDIIPNQGQLSDLSENLRSHAENTWRNVQETLESKFVDKTKSLKKSKPFNVLEAISQNHEDVNDKLRALHIDFNDRIESMRNSLIDSSRHLGGITSKKPKIKSLSGRSDKYNGKQLTLHAVQSKPASKKESKKMISPRTFEQQRKSGSVSPKTALSQKKFKMPSAASVPVPQTVEIPRLRATSTKSPTPSIQKHPVINSPITNSETNHRERLSDRWEQAGTNLRKANSSFGRKINPFKDSQIKVSFSTTPRPAVPSRNFKGASPLLKTSKSEKSRVAFDQRDTNGLPSEVINSMVSPPSKQNLDLSDADSQGRSIDRSNDELNLQNSMPMLSNNEVLRTDIKSKSTYLQSWPKASESAFLSKVKEAVKTRLSKLGSSGKTKQSFETEKSLNGEISVPMSETDMTRSASTNVAVIEQPLKENVSYKCTMVCTKE